MLDYQTEVLTQVVIFDVPLLRQPDYFLLNDEQTITIIAS